MSYLHIDNLYKAQHILAFRRCFALEKVHGTSAHVGWKGGILTFFSGGESHERFTALFDTEALRAKLAGIESATVYGEAYGGKCQGMSGTYGKELRFIAFEVKIGECWLAVPQAAQFVADLGLEFVPYEEGPTDLEWIDVQRDAPSVVAVCRGMGERPREGVVLRPPFEVTLNNGERIIAKYKRDEFGERKTPQKIVDPEKLAVLADATAVAEEWVTEMRLTHVLNAALGATTPEMEHVPTIIKAMVEDVLREGAGEIVDGKDVRRAIGSRAVSLLKARITARLRA